MPLENAQFYLGIYALRHGTFGTVASGIAFHFIDLPGRQFVRCALSGFEDPLIANHALHRHTDEIDVEE